VRKALALALALALFTVATAVLLLWALERLGARSVWFSFAVVWLPMTWLGGISHVIAFRLPDRLHALRAFERDGRLYELLGVRVVKWLLRRGPMALFNPNLHVPAEPTPARVAQLDGHMRVAEATHAILFVATLGVVANAGLRGWWRCAGWTLLFDLLANGYPFTLQRYNRALLERRFR
jgi:hypothetical protein